MVHTGAEEMKAKENALSFGPGTPGSHQKQVLALKDRVLRGYPLAHLLMKFLCLTRSAKEISLCLLPLWGDSAPLLRLSPSLALGRCWRWWVFLLPGQPRQWGCSAGPAAPSRCAGGSDPQVALPNTCACDPSITWYHLQPHRPPTSLPC